LRRGFPLRYGIGRASDRLRPAGRRILAPEFDLGNVAQPLLGTEIPHVPNGRRRRDGLVGELVRRRRIAHRVQIDEIGAEVGGARPLEAPADHSLLIEVFPRSRGKFDLRDDF
jgi:hypothetical protein